jgi:RNA polymerase sigma factor (sigma-70 family)
MLVQEQLQALYVDNHGWLQGWLNKKTGCSYRASDLLHDTFVRLLARDECIQSKEPKAHLIVVAKRVLFDHWRRERIEKAYFDMLAQQPQEYVVGPESHHIVVETLMEIDSLLDGLPVIVKRVFLYAQLDGLKQAEIAKKLDISVSTVKRYLVKAGVQCYFISKVD